MKTLPEFRNYSAVDNYLKRVLHDYVRDVVHYPDKHYRVIFDTAYFALAEGNTEPTRSQWNTLKKKFKHVDPRVFVFKDYGTAIRDDKTCYYIDFGFFADK